MTEREDWQFRAQYLEDAAKRLEVQAAKLMEQANDYRSRAENVRGYLKNQPQTCQ
jgi:hypothetical protein